MNEFGHVDDSERMIMKKHGATSFDVCTSTSGIAAAEVLGRYIPTPTSLDRETFDPFAAVQW